MKALSAFAHVRRFCGDAVNTEPASDTKSLTLRDWETLLSRVTNLMTRRIILEAATSEHLRQKFSAIDDLLGVLIILERVLRCRQIGRAQ
jgi:hypothetical protein